MGSRQLVFPLVVPIFPSGIDAYTAGFWDLKLLYPGGSSSKLNNGINIPGVIFDTRIRSRNCEKGFVESGTTSSRFWSIKSYPDAIAQYENISSSNSSAALMFARLFSVKSPVRFPGWAMKYCFLDFPFRWGLDLRSYWGCGFILDIHFPLQNSASLPCTALDQVFQSLPVLHH